MLIRLDLGGWTYFERGWGFHGRGLGFRLKKSRASKISNFVPRVRFVFDLDRTSCIGFPWGGSMLIRLDLGGWTNYFERVRFSWA
jgi:hypothetical protein